MIEVLKVAFVHGRLDRDELDLRVGRALAARTYEDLAALTADIPARPTRARPPEPTRESVNKKAVAAMAWATAAFIGIWPVMILTQDGSPFAVPVFVVWLVLAMAVPTGWLVLLHDWLDKRAGPQSAQGLPPGAGGEASQRPAPAGLARPVPGGRAAPAGRSRWAAHRRSGTKPPSPPALARVGATGRHSLMRRHVSSSLGGGGGPGPMFCIQATCTYGRALVGPAVFGG